MDFRVYLAFCPKSSFFENFWNFSRIEMHQDLTLLWQHEWLLRHDISVLNSLTLLVQHCPDRIWKNVLVLNCKGDFLIFGAGRYNFSCVLVTSDHHENRELQKQPKGVRKFWLHEKIDKIKLYTGKFFFFDEILIFGSFWDPFW